MAVICTTYRYGVWLADSGMVLPAQHSTPVRFSVAVPPLSTNTSGVQIAQRSGVSGWPVIRFQVPGLWRVNATFAVGGNINTGAQFEAWFVPWEGDYAVGLRPSNPKSGYAATTTSFSGQIAVLHVDRLVEITASQTPADYSFNVFNGQSTATISPITTLQESVLEAHLLDDWSVV